MCSYVLLSAMQMTVHVTGIDDLLRTSPALDDILRTSPALDDILRTPPALDLHTYVGLFEI